MGAILFDDPDSPEIQTIQQIPVSFVINDPILQIAHNIIHPGIIWCQSTLHLHLSDLTRYIFEVEIGNMIDMSLQEIQRAAVALLPIPIGRSIVAVIKANA